MSKLEPVAYLHTCRKKPSSKALKWQKDDPTLKSKGYVAEPLVKVDQAEAYAAAKVREALEKAAKVCDEYWKELDIARKSGSLSKYIEGALDCADILEQRIRALIPSQTGDSNVATD